MKTETVETVLMWCGLISLTAGMAMDRTSLVLAAFIFFWMVNES